jgi:hypothetical protein
VITELRSTGDADAPIIDEVASAISFTTRHLLQQALDQRPHGRLHLDPDERNDATRRVSVGA